MQGRKGRSKPVHVLFPCKTSRNNQENVPDLQDLLSTGQSDQPTSAGFADYFFGPCKNLPRLDIDRERISFTIRASCRNSKTMSNSYFLSISLHPLPYLILAATINYYGSLPKTLNLTPPEQKRNAD
jgi:hypothetical protein